MMVDDDEKVEYQTFYDKLSSETDVEWEAAEKFFENPKNYIDTNNKPKGLV
jgi:hypothetical protein